MIRELEGALSWLYGLGVSTERTRFATYLRTLQFIDKRWREVGDLRASDIPVDPILMETCALEASQLIRIWQGLADSPPTGLTTKLKILVGGPELEIREKVTNAGNAARDCGFELDLAAYFRRVSEVDLMGGVDVVARFRTMPIFIECKRPSSRKKIATNLDRASAQILTQLHHTSLACYGIPAISVTKAHWNGWPLVRAQSIESIRASVAQRIGLFRSQYINPWFTRQKDARMAAVLVHFPYIGYTGDSPTMIGTEMFVLGDERQQRGWSHRDLADLITLLGVIE